MYDTFSCTTEAGQDQTNNKWHSSGDLILISQTSSRPKRFLLSISSSASSHPGSIAAQGVVAATALVVVFRHLLLHPAALDL